MFAKVRRRVVALFAPKGSIEREIYYLKRSITKSEKELDRIYSIPGPFCCHGCAFPELYDLEDKQDRRQLRLVQLQTKVKNNV